MDSLLDGFVDDAIADFFDGAEGDFAVPRRRPRPPRVRPGLRGRRAPQTISATCLRARRRALRVCRNQQTPACLRARRAAQLCVNRQTGAMAHARLGRALAKSGFHQQRREVGIRGRRRLDLIAQRPNQRGFIYESKHINLGRYLTPQGQLDVPRLRSLLRRHIAQVQRYQADRALVRLNRIRQQRGVPPVRVRLVYQVPAGTRREQAAAFQRLMLTMLSPLGLAGTVIMPGTRAANAFDADSFYAY